MNWLILLRRTLQLASFALFVSTFLAALDYSAGIIPPGILFRVDPVIISVTSLAGRFIAPGLLVSAIMLILTAVFGRFFCGWLCPMGTMLDAVSFVIRKKRERDLLFGAAGRKVKFFILSALILTAMTGRSGGILVDPLVLMSNLVTLNMALPNIAMLSAAIVPVFFVRRFWCRFLCPLGALYAAASAMAPFRRIISKKSCSSCGECYKTCRMGAIRKDAGYVKSECVLCMDCIYECPGRSTRFGWK